MTDAERKLWHSLRGHRFQGLGFRRQVPLGPYIADFACHRAKLIVEVDGGQHGFEAHAARDRVRDAWLAGEGYRTLRFSNHDVLRRTESVLDTLFAACEPFPTPETTPGALQ
jgi:very-short-patch-repair endonuclease